MKLKTFVFFCILAGPMVQGIQAKTVIGNVETIKLEKLDVELLGRSSTVAEISALHATNIKLIKDGNREFVMFTTMAGGKKIRLNAKVHSRVSAGIFYKRNKKVKIRSKKHIVILTKVRLGKVSVKVRVALYDLGYLQQRFVIGRNILAHGFLVDVTKSRALSDE